MKGAVNTAVLTDALVVLGSGVVPAHFELLEREFVRSIAVNLVGTEENEDRIRTMETGGFEEIEGAESVDFKIKDGDIACLVIRGWAAQ